MTDVAAIVLAAGRSTRMGVTNKLTHTWQGKPLIRHALDAVVASNVSSVVVVTGHEDNAVRAVLPTGVAAVHNPDFAEGMATSIRAGLTNLGVVDAVMILLGDMPLVTSGHINGLMQARAENDANSIIVATCGGTWGNPVLFNAPDFEALSNLEGDRGARALLNANKDRVVEIEIGVAARQDFDTPDAFERS